MIRKWNLKLKKTIRKINLINRFNLDKMKFLNQTSILQNFGKMTNFLLVIINQLKKQMNKKLK